MSELKNKYIKSPKEEKEKKKEKEPVLLPLLPSQPNNINPARRPFPPPEPKPLGRDAKLDESLLPGPLASRHQSHGYLCLFVVAALTILPIIIFVVVVVVFLFVFLALLMFGFQVLVQIADSLTTTTTISSSLSSSSCGVRRGRLVHIASRDGNTRQAQEIRHPHVPHALEGLVPIAETEPQLAARASAAAVVDAPARARRCRRHEEHAWVLCPQVRHVLAETAAEFLREEVVCGRGGAAKGEEDTVGRRVSYVVLDLLKIVQGGIRCQKRPKTHPPPRQIPR